MILRTEYLRNTSTFSLARSWKRYSLPMRRAGSPLHFSSVPRMAKSTFPAWRIFTSAVAMVLARSSNDAAQPTQ